MKYKFFTISARYPEDSEAAMNAFCSQHRISFIEKHLVADGADSFWTICITWLDGEAAASGAIKSDASSIRRMLPTIGGASIPKRRCASVIAPALF